MEICSARARQDENQTLNGAYGCRVRHIKCDETRTHCVRCTSTGRKCDGYTEQSPATILPDPSLTVLTINSAAGHVPECRAFDFFRTCTLPNVSLHFGSPPWVRLLLQACYSEPALQHAATALGALHEHLENGNTFAYQPITHRDSGMNYATQQYTQALISLSTLLTKSDNRSIELALIGALVCMYYELLQENFETTQLHLESCLMVLQPMLPSQSSWLTITTNNKTQIDNDIIQTFARLDIEASCTLGKRSPSLCIATIPLEIPTHFTSINQARHLLYGLTSQLHSFMRSTADAYATNLTAIPLPTIAEAKFLQTSLKEWASSFSAFLSHPTTKLTLQDQQGANILSVQQKVTYMKAATCLYADEMIFDQFDQEFEEILCLAKYLIYLSNNADGVYKKNEGKRKVVLTFDMGIIEALFWTAIKCRCRSIRHRAIGILKEVTWQEGVWNAEMMAAMAETFVMMEEEGMNGVHGGYAVSGEEVRVPEWLRLHDHGWEMNLKGRRTKVRAGRRENGVEGEWTWVREEIIW